jgi:phosphatidylglycerol:prolipoprotein diacylglycerol transferase
MFAYVIWNPNPQILDFGFFSLRWYSLFFAFGFVLSYLNLKKRFQQENINVSLLEKLTVYVALGTIIGARLGHCLFYDFNYYRHHLVEVFLPVQFSPHFKIIGYQGLASHGGALGILTALYFFSRKYQGNYWWLLDQLALVVPLAGCCIRLGNLMNSEIIGKPANIKWAFVFVREDTLPRHPTQLYEAVAYLLIFVIIHFINKISKQKPGYLFGLFLLLVFGARFLIEAFKENQSAFEAGMPLNMGQLLSIPFIIIGVLLIVMKTRPVLYQ